MIHVGRIGRRYALWIAALAFVLVGLALVAAGAIAFRQSRLAQRDIREAIAEASRADQEEALRGTATYLGQHLFNALYQLDVDRLNGHIAQIRSWLPLGSFLVIDREGRILTDGTPTNERYGEVFEDALPGQGAPDIQLVPVPSGTELRFVISSGGTRAGWGAVEVRPLVVFE